MSAVDLLDMVLPSDWNSVLSHISSLLPIIHPWYPSPYSVFHSVVLLDSAKKWQRHLTVYAWLISLSSISSKFTHVAANVKTFSFFKAQWCSRVCVHTPHSSFPIHHRLIVIDRYRLRIMVHTVTESLGVWVSLQHNDLIFFAQTQ